MQFDADGKERGGFWLYVPETYVPDHVWPFVMALHGGSGTERLFLWSWLRERGAKARSWPRRQRRQTWDCGGGQDTPNLERILSRVARWNVDERSSSHGHERRRHVLLCVRFPRGSPFTHLAPVAAAFHPIGQMADPDRMRGLPIHIVHGAHDWMFPSSFRDRHVRHCRVQGRRCPIYGGWMI